MIPLIPDDSATLVLRRVFKAKRPRVFRAWIEPDVLQLWFRPRGLRMTVSQLEARVGGSFRFDIENGVSITGTYLHVIPPQRLSFTWSDASVQGQETIVTLDFFDLGTSTEVVLTHERLSTQEMRALFSGGWPSLLDLLAQVISGPQDVQGALRC
ncbi:SRPBCC family protein [Dictyobacter aurantiacus]|uniref:Activator of Hsp90 ATPase homologue 1/2-like C-terminal domain-containing protein n=1 Tax=Dictyobacter aurantiacus TaxID=1936993 RepID=A0A401ZI88_9CHLR|nr:SRPBCC domain-containing protein [Dictyobacter aurantiacus]GCE06561.1 hypothetical protein KDAU_38900 [Dictyobacter aurantiacus]